MNEKQLKLFKRKLALNALLAEIFGKHELVEKLKRLEEEQRSTPVENITIDEGPKPLKFLSNFNDNRFKALKDKALAREVAQEESASVAEGDNGTAGS